MYKLAPSILSADFGRLAEEVKEVTKAGAEYLHIDVMDGMFVPSISFGMPVIKSIRSATDCFFDVHLMIEDPDRYLEAFAEAGADGITVHAEACRHLQRTVQRIKELGKKACVALNPATPLSVLDYVLEDLDMVLIMSVNPGFGGQKLIENSIEKVAKLRQMIKERGLNIEIEIDGGVKLDNASRILEAGVDVLVAGTAVFKGDKKQNVSDFLEVFADADGRYETGETAGTICKS
ncbi:MAG: ribulose-phosphate 3-epimerase [Acetivibrio ethanolgignens]